MKKKLILLFLLACVVRIVFCLSYDVYELYPDVKGYHMYAVNLIENGHYSYLQSPTADLFFREPAGIYVLKMAYQIASVFGIEASPILGYSMEECSVLEYHPEFYWGRIIFSLIDSLSVCFFFLTLLFFTTQRRAFIIACIYLLFFPLFFYLQTLLRDSFQVSLLLILNYFFVRYLFKGDRIALTLVGVLLGVAILTLKALAFIGLVIVAYIFIIHRKSIKRVFIDTTLVTVVSLLTITPWMIRVYNYYPDVKVVKELGTSLTYDLNEYCTSLRVLRFAGLIPVDESEEILVNTWGMDSKDQFTFSFNKEFEQKTDSIYSLMGDMKQKYIKRYRINSYRKAMENLLYPNALWGISSTSFVRQLNTFVSPVFFLMGMLGFVGLIFFFKKYWKGLMVYLSFIIILCFVPSFGDEGRRLLLFYSLWIPLSLQMSVKIFFYMKKGYYICRKAYYDRK